MKEDRSGSGGSAPPLVIFTTASSEAEAMRIGQALVELRLAACCTLIRGATSIYRWNESVEVSEEVILMVKSTEACFDELREHVVRMHSYEVPELIAVGVERGLESYLAWIASSVEKP